MLPKIVNVLAKTKDNVKNPVVIEHELDNNNNKDAYYEIPLEYREPEYLELTVTQSDQSSETTKPHEIYLNMEEQPTQVTINIDHEEKSLSNNHILNQHLTTSNTYDFPNSKKTVVEKDQTAQNIEMKMLNQNNKDLVFNGTHFNERSKYMNSNIKPREKGLGSQKNIKNKSNWKNDKSDHIYEGISPLNNGDSHVIRIGGNNGSNNGIRTRNNAIQYGLIDKKELSEIVIDALQSHKEKKGVSSKLVKGVMCNLAVYGIAITSYFMPYFYPDTYYKIPNFMYFINIVFTVLFLCIYSFGKSSKNMFVKLVKTGQVCLMWIALIMIVLLYIYNTFDFKEYFFDWMDYFWDVSGFAANFVTINNTLNTVLNKVNKVKGLTKGLNAINKG